MAFRSQPVTSHFIHQHSLLYKWWRSNQQVPVAFTIEVNNIWNKLRKTKEQRTFGQEWQALKAKKWKSRREIQARRQNISSRVDNSCCENPLECLNAISSRQWYLHQYSTLLTELKIFDIKSIFLSSETSVVITVV